MLPSIKLRDYSKDSSPLNFILLSPIEQREDIHVYNIFSMPNPTKNPQIGTLIACSHEPVLYKNTHCYRFKYCSTNHLLCRPSLRRSQTRECNKSIDSPKHFFIKIMVKSSWQLNACSLLVFLLTLSLFLWYHFHHCSVKSTDKHVCGART